MNKVLKCYYQSKIKREISFHNMETETYDINIKFNFW